MQQLSREEMTSTEKSVIQEFYAGCNVFVTGATGFLGKVLIEKLLRSCPDINAIYVMVRSKRGKKAEERIDEITSSPCFSRLLLECPTAVTKLRAVVGDISCEKLGMSQEDAEMLATEIDVVFHVAATVNMMMNLGSSIKMNVRGTRDMLLLAKTFTHLKAFMYVSTAYSQCPRPSINEEFYQMKMSPDETIALVDTVSSSEFDDKRSQFLGLWPNTYSFTKAIAENTVKQYGADLPAGILRPSIVIWTHNEPMPGWLDNFYGAGGVAASIFSGLGHTMQMDPHKDANVIPCDVVVNGLIAGAWDVAHNWYPKSQNPIYNSVASAKKPINWDTFFGHVQKLSREMPSAKTLSYPFWRSTKFKLLSEILLFFWHILPAICMDGLMVLMGKKRIMLSQSRRMNYFNRTVAYFCIREWKYEENNLVKLWNTLDVKDKTLFPFDMSSMNWEHFMKDTFLGFRTHLMKERPETIPAAKRRLRRLVWIQLALVSVGVSIVCACVNQIIS